jgi:hypothetical protein
MVFVEAFFRSSFRERTATLHSTTKRGVLVAGILDLLTTQQYCYDAFDCDGCLVLASLQKTELLLNTLGEVITVPSQHILSNKQHILSSVE